MGQSAASPGGARLADVDPRCTAIIDAWSGGRLERDLPPGEYAVRVLSSAGERKVRLAVPSGRTIKLVLDPPTRSIVQRPWFWITVGVVVAGGVTGAILATRPRHADPLTDPYWGATAAAFRF